MRWPWQRRASRPARPAPSASPATAKLLARRRRYFAKASLPAPGSIGLALSGGGIRSATISLGALQSLAKLDRLKDFDYVSTVSGGGYAGTFLTSLFLPDSPRGLQGGAHIDYADADILKKRDWAIDALKLAACESEMPDPARVAIRSPVWWLREHSRYLAPNGPTDYLSATTYFARAWLAMIYVFTLPIAVWALIATVCQWWIVVRLPRDFGPRAEALLTVTNGGVAHLLSPLYFVSAMLLFVALAAGVAYWETEWLPRVANRAAAALRRALSPKIWFLAGLGVTSAVAIAFGWWYWPGVVGAFASGGSFAARFLATGLALLIAAQIIGAAVFVRVLLAPDAAFTAQTRMALTQIASVANLLFLVTLLLASTESVALYLQSAALAPRTNGHPGFAAWLLSAVPPAAAWLINLLSRSADGGGRWREWLTRLSGPLMAVVGVALFTSLAIFVELIVHWLIYPFGLLPGNVAMAQGEPQHLPAIAASLAILIVVTGSSTGFINLSSLHNLYASRLTRAYLGASNIARLREVVADDAQRSIIDSHVRDDIDVATYQRQPSAGPLHLINVTLNETRSREESQIVERDRKGVPLVFAPEGVFVDAGRCSNALYTWARIKYHDVERLSVGQLCAISGAAASTGMGSHTTLGMALTMSFANIRLGYWWDARDLLKTPTHFTKEPVYWLYLKVTRPFRTYFYLFNEMTARYSRDYSRLYLSDGGHFDNSGVYELLRRRVPVILALDNGADPKYEFADLENLVRKARIDLGLSINAAARDEVVALLGAGLATKFLNGTHVDWRKAAGTPGGTGVAVLLKVYASTGAAAGRVPPPNGYIVWVKPRFADDMPQDIDGYALANPDFPHQSTGNQFFNEAQWESYRGLGFCHMAELFDRTAPAGGVLRALLANLQPAPPKPPKPRKPSAAKQPAAVVVPPPTARRPVPQRRARRTK